MVRCGVAEIVLVSADFEIGEEGVVARAPVDRRGNGSRGVESADVVRQHFADPRPVGSSRSRDLVADAPHHHRWMVAIAQHHGVDVALPPLVEEDAVIVSVFALRPAIERFVHDQHAQPVAGVEDIRGGRVVRGADGVEPGRLEHFDAPLLRAVEGRRPQGAVVVMHAPAAQLHRSPVDLEAVFR